MWRLVNGNFVFNLNLLLWLLGSIIGFMFVFGDRLIYVLISRSDETLSVKVKDLIAQRKIDDGLRLLLAERYDQKELVMRSFLFLVVWAVLGFFTMTSVTDFFARGFVLGIGIHLLFDFVYDYFTDRERLDLWFWQIKRTLEPEEKRWFAILISGIYLLLIFNL